VLDGEDVYRLPWPERRARLESCVRTDRETDGHSPRVPSGVTYWGNIADRVHRRSGQPHLGRRSARRGHGGNRRQGGEGCTGFTTLSITYRDVNGTVRQAIASGDNEVALTLDGVRDSWVARHGITFDDCAEDCFVTFTTQPK
jgi:hypothetical protein